MQPTNTYTIDEILYKSTGGHTLVLETTQYKIEDEILTKQVVHANIMKALPDAFLFGHESPQVFHFIENKNGQDRRIVSSSDFQKRLSRDGQAIKPTIYESIEQLHYTDARGQRCVVFIAIFQKGTDVRTATITFTSKNQLLYFTAPTWLKPLL